MVVADNIVWVREPDRGRGLVSVEKRPRASDIEDQVVLDQILRLNTILNEDSVAHSVVGDVVLYTEVVHAMNRHCTIERMVDGIVTHIRGMDCSDHVEVDRVGSENERLADMGQLNAIDAANC